MCLNNWVYFFIPEISVIVPVYNTEKYLNRCIDSILNQSFTDLELLLIDDGNKDCSGTICDQYALKDSRVRVFHKDNGGVSSARNLGLENASGDWVIFIDSDDWISEGMLQDMYEKATSEKSDLIYSNLKMIFNEHTGILHIAQYDSNKVNMLNNFIKSTFGTVVGMFVKRSLYEFNQVRFPMCVKFCKDFYVAVRLMLYSKKICYIPATYYCIIEKMKYLLLTLFLKNILIAYNGCLWIRLICFKKKSATKILLSL